MRIDHVFFLTTSQNTVWINRRVSLLKGDLALDNIRIRVIQSERDKEDARRGCFMAHQQAYQEFLRSSGQTVLILEDDVHFLKRFDPASLAVFNELKWDVIYLGHRPLLDQGFELKRMQYPGIAQVKTNDGHAMIINRTCVEKLVKFPWTGRALDTHIRLTYSSCYAIYPMIAIQLGSPGTPSFKNGWYELYYECMQVAGNPNSFNRKLKMITTTTRILLILLRSKLHKMLLINRSSLSPDS